MLYALAKLVSIPTVSDDVHRERYIYLPVRIIQQYLLAVAGKERTFYARYCLSSVPRQSW